MLLAVQFASAQQKLFVLSKSGNLWAFPANKVTFNYDPSAPTNAQYNMLVEDNDGVVKAVSVSSVNYAMFNDSGKWFAMTNDGVEDIQNNSITATCTFGLAADVKSLSYTPYTGVCYSKDNTEPTIKDNCLSLSIQLKSYTFTLKSLVEGTTYYFRPYVKLANMIFYGDVATAKTLGTKPVDNSKTINGHKFVDLGLASGLLWAETNIGAETAADDGDYFAWGETQSKSDYEWSTYKYGDSSSNISKYNSTDGKTALDKEDDAAYVNWGSSCRMPTSEEFTELLNSKDCTWTWTSKTTSSGSSINGYQVTSTKTGNSIFLPASGYRRREGQLSQGSNGYYWSTTLYAKKVANAYYLYFGNDNHDQDYYFRYDGRTVRPVTEP